MSLVQLPPKPSSRAMPPPRNRRPREDRPRGDRPRSRRGPERPWVVIFILLSLLAHLLFVLAIVVLNHFVPKPDLHVPPDQLSSTTISLEPPPPAPPPPPQHMFMPTTPDNGATHKETQIESANDTRLRSESTTARAPESVMPDVTAKLQHPANLSESPNAPSTQPPRAASPAAQPTPPQPKATASTKPSQHSNPHPAQAEQETPQPQPEAKETKPQPEKVVSPKAEPQQLDANGLPVLPPINAPTMAPASERHEETAPASSVPEVAGSIHGALGTHGANSPEAMKTELGMYKAKFYAAVGSRWYPAVDKNFQILPVGMVRIQYTIHSDGTIETKVLEGNAGNLQELLTISLDAIRDTSPFDPFTPAMIKEVGDSFTDDFTFSIYGGGE